MGSFTVPQSLRIARAISNATSIPADVAHHAVSQALMQPGTHGSGSGGSDKLPSPDALRGSMALKRDNSKRDRTSPLKNASNAGKQTRPVSHPDTGCASKCLIHSVCSVCLEVGGALHAFFDLRVQRIQDLQADVATMR